jgi:methionyl-tRNA synthetase
MEAIEVRKSTQAIRALWVLGNEYLQEAAPWSAIKTDRDRAAVVVRTGLNLAGLFARIAQPFVPDAAAKAAAAVGEAWAGPWPGADGRTELGRIPAGRKVSAPEVLFRKVEDAQIAEWSERFGGAEQGAAD